MKLIIFKGMATTDLSDLIEVSWYNKYSSKILIKVCSNSQQHKFHIHMLVIKLFQAFGTIS